jgi:hypothetical protein
MRHISYLSQEEEKSYSPPEQHVIFAFTSTLSRHQVFSFLPPTAVAVVSQGSRRQHMHEIASLKQKRRRPLMLSNVAVF